MRFFIQRDCCVVLRIGYCVFEFLARLGVNLALDMTPGVLDRVEVWALGWVIQDVDPTRLEKGSRDLGLVSWCVVLHKLELLLRAQHSDCL